MRSARDGKVFDLIPEVAEHFRVGRQRSKLKFWKFNRQIAEIPADWTLRILAARPFVLHWSRGDWNNNSDTDARISVIGLHYVDIPVPKGQTAPIRFTFRWLDNNQWEGKDFEVAVKPD